MNAVEPSADLDLDAMRARNRLAEVAIDRSSTPAWFIAVVLDGIRLIAEVEALRVQADSLREQLPWDGATPPAWQEIAEALAIRLSTAEACGWAAAVQALRDSAQFHAWRHPSPAPWQRKSEPREPNLLAAEYLKAVHIQGGTDGD